MLWNVLMGPETQCCHLQDIDIFIGIMIKLFLLLGSALKLSSVIVRPAAFILDEIFIEQLMQKLPAFEQSHFFFYGMCGSLTGTKRGKVLHPCPCTHSSS